jgi:hypothetical protein
VGCTGNDVGAAGEIKPALSWRTQAWEPAGKRTDQGSAQTAPSQQPFKKQPIRPTAAPIATAGATASAIRQKGNGCRYQ